MSFEGFARFYSGVAVLLVGTFSTAPRIPGLGWAIAGFAALYVLLTVMAPTAVIGVVHEVLMVRHGRREPDR